MGNTTYMNGFGRASASPLVARTDEGHLVSRLKKRDEAAYVLFVQKHKGAVYNVCLRMLSNTHEAEDIAQEVFMRAFMSIGTFREEAKLATWLYRIAMNLCRNRIKYHQRRAANRHMSVENLFEGQYQRSCGRITGETPPTPEESLEASQAQTRIQQALLQLDDDFRRLLVLRDLEGLSYLDIMKITGLPEGTVKSRLHRARAALTRAYRELGDENRK